MGEAEITCEAFPLSYELVAFNRKSPFGKLASATDLMRHEILYCEGSFWRDAGLNVLKPVFDQFLKYRLVVGAEMTSRHRWNQGMCFFTNEPRSKYLLRVTNFPNLNRMRIYEKNALAIAGPIDFRQVVDGYEEYDPDILIIQFEYFYPGQVGRPPFGDLRTKYTQELEEGEPV